MDLYFTSSVSSETSSLTNIALIYVIYLKISVVFTCANGKKWTTCKLNVPALCHAKFDLMQITNTLKHAM